MIVAKYVGMVLFAATAGTVSPAGQLSLDAGWAADAVWDDGLAEVATYEATRPIYGAARNYEAVLITVKEDFDGGTLVKADAPYGGRTIVPVLKQNAVREIPTPNYDYRIMTSTFVARDAPWRLLKLTSGSHEWCGNTWKAVRRREGRTTYDWASYFDGEADGVQELRIRPGDLFEDQLPLALRGLEFREGPVGDVRIAASLATSHAGPLEWRKATITVAGRETVEVPAGRFETWRVELVAGPARTTLWFETADEHRLVRMHWSTGDVMSLKRIERRAYWVLPRP